MHKLVTTVVVVHIETWLSQSYTVKELSFMLGDTSWILEARFGQLNYLEG